MLTILELRNLKPGQARKDAGVRGSGSLWFIASGSGRVHGVFRYRPAGAPSAKDYRIAPYDEAGRMGLNLVAMREKAAELPRLCLGGVSDLKAHFAALEQERLAAIEAGRQAAETAKAQQEAEAAARQHEEALRQKYSLAKLGELYEAHLRKAGKVKSANQVKSIFKVHILGAWPEVATLPANQVTAHQVAAMLCKVAEVRNAPAAMSVSSACRLCAGNQGALRCQCLQPLHPLRDPDQPRRAHPHGAGASP